MTMQKKKEDSNKSCHVSKYRVLQGMTPMEFLWEQRKRMIRERRERDNHKRAKI